ncbi:MAG: helix-turn-helix domain-containing protein [Lachnospiraceae bacterium]|nr:helix-turn-helix domain-containing protein [Lachnospiraceae bacterium]
MRITGYESNASILQEMGRRIRENRIESNYSQAEMSERSGVALSTLCRMEKGEGITLENLLKIMRALGCLSNLEMLVPDTEVRPVELADQKSKRKRVSRNRNAGTGSDWVWGEDKK